MSIFNHIIQSGKSVWFTETLSDRQVIKSPKNNKGLAKVEQGSGRFSKQKENAGTLDSDDSDEESGSTHTKDLRGGHVEGWNRQSQKLNTRAGSGDREKKYVFLVFKIM